MANVEVLTDGGATNLYLPKSLKKEARRIAKERYGISLSNLVQRLLVAEISRKRGIAHLHPRQLEGGK